jgi:hypothetical protein
MLSFNSYVHGIESQKDALYVDYVTVQETLTQKL